ncbi:hypothetical protein PAPYR_11344 [Paratrimastix pyriformis]|uniref:Lipid-binding serum glycoprotein N-terminal domain-containing protein n=1 Tax=Paratrimastix pyriformis TaxID=342808 RepID=A0ABQ8U3Z1_9EUKA|nr:hypothetical protein PAPYR_11344 [Paratrimastix pyriformis]
MAYLRVRSPGLKRVGPECFIAGHFLLRVIIVHLIAFGEFEDPKRNCRPADDILCRVDAQPVDLQSMETPFKLGDIAGIAHRWCSSSAPQKFGQLPRAAVGFPAKKKRVSNDPWVGLGRLRKPGDEKKRPPQIVGISPGKMRSLVALLALFLFAAAQSPAVKTSISDKSFQKIVDQFMPLVDSKLATITVPDINQTVDTKIGKVQISLTDIIAHVAPPNVGVSVAQGKGIMGSISQLSTQVDLNFDFNVVKIFSGRGSAHVTTTNGNVNLIIDIVDQDGKPALVVAGNQIDFGKLDIKISSSSGIPSWIENILVNLLADILKNTLQKTIQNEVATLVQQLSDKYLTKMPTIVPLDSHVQVDMALAGNPIFNGGFVTFPLVGAFQERSV